MINNIPELIEIVGDKARMRCSECGEERLVRLQSIKQNIKRGKYTGLCSKCSYKHRVGKLMSSTPRRSQNGYGYIRVALSPDDFFYPMVRKDGRVLEHRLVMAQHIGRCLQPWEQVHHKGIRYTGIENKQDNQRDNLELTTNGSHQIAHHKGYKDGYRQGYEDGKRKADQETHKAIVQEIFEEIENLKAKEPVPHTFDDIGVEDCILIKVKDWQALKQKYGVEVKE